MASSANIPVIKARLIGTGLLLLFMVALNSACTQFVAWRLSYHPSLGAPLAGALYPPFDWWSWLFRFYAGAPETYNYAFIIFALGVLAGLLTYVLATGFVTRSSRMHDDVHGSARFATLEDIEATGLAGKRARSGVYCGGFDDPRSGRTVYLRHDGPEHICALAPTRSGKGVGLVVPTLLSWPDSVFVLDRKGENFAMTAGWRKRHAGNVVLRFDPAEPDSGCSWNALAEIRFRTRYQVSDTQNIALMVIDDDGKGIAGDHFRSAAYELLIGLILHALYKSDLLKKPLPGLCDIAHMLTGTGAFAATPTEKTENAKLSGTQNQDDDAAATGAFNLLFEEMKNVVLDAGSQAAREAQLVITSVGQRMSATPARELGSIVSTANNALALYRDPIVGENTTRGDFKVDDLMNHDCPVSLFSVMTPRNADRLRPLNRLLLTQIVLALADRMEFDGGRSKTRHRHRLLLMLDEFPTLGRLDVFESALAYIAGYGMKAYLISQDVAQLFKAYTNYESIISNCHVRIAFAPNKVDTAEWMSKMTGVTTVVKEQVSTSGRRFGLVLDQVSRSYQEVQRPLLTADEIMQLPGPRKDAAGNILEAGEMLVFVAGHPVIRGRQILYFLDPVFAARSRIPPPKTSDRVRGTPAMQAPTQPLPPPGPPGFVVPACAAPEVRT
ncbi:MAG: type IV secretory system conjugative DNA transfer family protein [Bradyrhizobium sp.]